MPTYADTRDPRSIVTPDAFEVSEELLGMPLARPARRLAAMAVDLVVIGIITLVTNSFALILGVVAAALFIRQSFKRTEVRGSVFGRAMRLSLGCLGLAIGVVTLLVWVAVRSGPELADLGSVPGVEVRGPDGAPSGTAGLGELAGLLGGGVGLVTAEDADEAREAMETLVRRGRAVGTTDDDIREAVLELAPDDAPWREEVPALLDEVMAEVPEEAAEEGARTGAEAGEPGEAPPAVAGEPDAAAPSPQPVSALSLPAALEEYALLVEAEGRGALDEAGTARREELRRVLVAQVAADTVEALENEIAQLERIAESRQEAVVELTRALESLEEEAEGGGLFGWLRELVDELGFGFGWATLYMTVVLSWWQGRTVGKRLMGIRVVRLDGQPLTWWTAFERAGGYAAGFATGLLGFAQVWWDANRQAIHDRIVGTVVVVDGAERVGKWTTDLPRRTT